MAKSTRKLTVYPLTGGLFTARNSAQLGQQDLVKAKNVMYDRSGASLKKRYGIEEYYVSGFSSTANPKGVFDFFRNVSGVQTHKMITYVDGKIYADNLDGVFSDITGAVTLSVDDSIRFDTFIGLLIMTFDSVSPKMWTMSGNVIDLPDVPGGGNAPSCKYYRTHLGFGWLAGQSDAPHRIYRSAVGDPTAWSGAGTEYFDINAGDADPDGITALFPSFNNNLYVAKRHSIDYIYFDTSGNFGVSSFTKGIGCINQNTVVAIDNDILFCSERGVHSLSTTDKYGDVTTSFLSAKIQNIFDDEFDLSRGGEMWATYSPELNSYLLSFPKIGSSLVTDILCYNIANGQWTRWENMSIAGMAKFIDSDKYSRTAILSGDANVGLLSGDETTDFGDPINIQISTSKLFPLGSPVYQATFTYLKIMFVPKGRYSFTVSYKVNGKTIDTMSVSMEGETSDPLGPTFITGQSSLGFLGNYKEITLPLKGIGNSIELIINHTPLESNDYDERFNILGYSIDYEYAEDTNETIIS